MMPTLSALCAIMILAIAPSVGAKPIVHSREVLLPRPAGIEAQVRFWTRIYSEVDQGGGLIHDSREMNVVYETIRYPEGFSSRSREKYVERAKDRYVTTLKKLATGKRTGLSIAEKQVLALWPDGVSNKTLRDATSRVRFQLGQADRFREGLVRAGQWRVNIEKALSDHGVPAELIALPHVESSYNPAAYSRVGAAGLWQFTRGTGRLFLRLDTVVDERMDPFAASDAAARLLRANYNSLGSWPLAITAYNHGVAGMGRAVRKLGTTDISVIVKKHSSRTFGFASRNFYTELLAAIDVSTNAEHHFGPVIPLRAVQYKTVTLEHFYPASAIESALGVNNETLHDHNRALRPAVWNGAKHVPKGFVLRVPSDHFNGSLAMAIASIPVSQQFAAQHRDRLYKVRSGDSLSKIASRYHVRESQLMALNNLRNRHRIRAGQILILPDEPGSRAPISVARMDIPTDGIYKVRRGDTISRIATRFGVSETSLVSLNGLRNRNLISVGQKLMVATITAASAPAKLQTTTIAAISPSPSAASVVRAQAPKPVEPPARKVEPQKPVQVIASTKPPTPAEAVTEQRPVGSMPVVPAPDPSDYAVTLDGSITVQAAETLGHYADWLEVATNQLRRLNGMSYSTPVAIGRQTRLDFSVVTPEIFEQRRLEFHQSLQEEFFDAFEVVGTDTHKLRRGDTLWELAEMRYRIPIWLLRQYNPTLDFSALQRGAYLTIPRIQSRRG
jgi:membrane-bound lytic murein transglycosylase D